MVALGAEQAAVHRGGADHGHIAAGGGGHQHVPGLVDQQVVLAEGDHRDEGVFPGQDVAHQHQVGAGETDVLAETLFADFEQGFEGAVLAEDSLPAGLFGFVDLQQVDAVALQAFEAGFEAAPDGVAGVVERLGVVADLGGQVAGLGDALEGDAQHFFAASLAVQGGGVEVVDAQFQGAFDHGHAVLHGLEAELGAAVEPGAAQADFADLPVCLAEASVFHSFS